MLMEKAISMFMGEKEVGLIKFEECQHTQSCELIHSLDSGNCMMCDYRAGIFHVVSGKCRKCDPDDKSRRTVRREFLK